MATYGSSAAQQLITNSFGGFNSGMGIKSDEDEVRLLNGLLALGYDPAQVQAFSDRDPSRRFLGDAITRALRAGISEADIRKAINFDEVARTEHDPVRRVQRLAEALGLDTGRISQLAAQRGNTPDAWINAVEQVRHASQMTGSASGSYNPMADTTFRQYATSQQATYVGKAGAVNQPGVHPAEGALPSTGLRGYHDTAAPPTLGGQTPGAGGPAPGTGGGPGAGGTPPPVRLTPEQIRADIESRYGWAAAFVDIPEVAKILQDAADGRISAEEANRRWLGTNYYKETSVNERNWRILEKSNPGEARVQMESQYNSILSRAKGLGVDLDPARAKQIADMSKRFGWSDQQIAASLASEVKWDPNGAKTGVMAQIKGAQQAQLVPLSDQAMTQWAGSIVSGDKSLDDFNAYLKDQAKSLFPTIANYLDTTPGGTVKTYLDPYAQTISQTLGMPAGDINWMDPKYYRFVNASDPKTGQRRTVDIADVQRTLIADPQYNYDQTANGKQQKASLARTVLSDWGFIADTGTKAGGFG